MAFELSETNTGLLEPVLQFINTLISERDGLDSRDPSTVHPDLDLIESGIIDSLSIMELISFVEDETGTQIELEELLLDSVRTPRTIASVYGQPSSDHA